MGSFRSREEFQELFDRLFSALSSDPEVGPKLAGARSPQRYLFPDLDARLDVRDAVSAGLRNDGHLVWHWNRKKLPWKPDVVLEMSSDVANRFFQGKENVPLGLARGIIRVREGDVTKALDLLPILRPFHPRWVARLKSEGMAHLLAR